MMIKMRKSPLMLSLLTCGMFAGFSAYVPSAQASTTYSDGAPWSVQAVRDDEVYDKSYCVAGRQYKDGTILSFAKNKKAETSVAVDFLKPRFESGTFLQVTLDPGANQLRSYDLKPASDQAVIIRLGEDHTFMDALRRTGFLRAEMKGENFNFALSDIKAVQNNLQTCLASIVSDVAAVPVPDVAIDLPSIEPVEVGVGTVEPDVETVVFDHSQVRVVEEELEVQKELLVQKDVELANAQNELEALRAEKLELENNPVAVTETVVFEKPADTSAMESELQAKEELFDEKNIALADAQRELAVLKTEKESLESHQAAEQEALYKKSQEYQEIRDENAALKVKIGMMSEEAEKVTSIEQSFEELKAKNEDLSKAYAEQASLSATLADEKERLQDSNKVLVDEKNEAVAQAHKTYAEEKSKTVAQSLFETAAASVETVSDVVVASVPSVSTSDVASKSVTSVVKAIDPRPMRVETVSPPVAEEHSDHYVVRMSDVKAEVNGGIDLHLPMDEGMSEAQRYEARLVEQISPRQSVEDNYGAPSVAGDVVEEAFEAASVEQERQPLEESVSWRAAEGQGIVEEDLVAERIPPAPVVEDLFIATKALAPQDREIEAVPPAPVQRTPVYFSPDYNIEQILGGAGIAEQGAVRFVEKASNARKLAYQWQNGQVFGAAEQTPFADGDNFDDVALVYLNKTQARCPGEFAVVPDLTEDQNGVRVDSYEIACIAEGVSSTASVIFFSRSGTFTKLTHETPANNMDQAMTMKEKVFGYLLGRSGS